MIYVVYGTDTIKARAKWHAVIDSLLLKRPETSLYKLDPESSSVSDLEELVFGQSLFSQKYIVACDQLLADPELADFIRKNLKDLAKVDHLFVLLEETIEKKLLTSFEKQAFKVTAHDLVEEKKGESFNVFSLTDALGARDKRRLWLLYQEALSKNFSEEEIFWKLAWQVKTMLLVKTAKPADKLNLHPYVLQKNQGYASKYKLEELKEIFRKLVDLYHLTRQGEVDFKIGLEQLILEV